jgi:outer membrane lipoprotein carrier protein
MRMAKTWESVNFKILICVYFAGLIPESVALAFTGKAPNTPPATTEPGPSPTVTLTEPEANTTPLPESKATDPKPVEKTAPSPEPTPIAPAPAPTPTPSPTSPTLPEALRLVDERYQKGKTVRAKFEQKEYIASTGRTKTTQGTIEIKRPSKLRWETRAPGQNLLVSDGKTFWFYTPPFDEEERGQLIERKSSQVQSRLAQTLISGSFSDARGLKVETIDSTHYRLVPKKGTAGTVRTAEVVIDLEKNEITQVKLEHRGGNRSEIKLSNIELGSALPDELFRFVAPPNTDRINPEE